MMGQLEPLCKLLTGDVAVWPSLLIPVLLLILYSQRHIVEPLGSCFKVGQLIENGIALVWG